MSKVQLKRQAATKQGDRCAISGARLAKDSALVDTDRETPKLQGGVYDDENTRAVDPRAHMARHGTLRERDEALEKLKSMFDDRVQTMKLQFKINNQLLAYERRVDHSNPETAAFLREQLEVVARRLSGVDKTLTKLIRTFPDPLTKIALAVPGVGPITVAAMTVYVDLTKAPNVSSLWQYVGLDRPSHERYVPNIEQQRRRKERGAEWYGGTDAVPTGWGGNKTLRTVLFTTVSAMVKMGDKCAYRLVYDRTKLRLSQSEKVTRSRNTQGKLVEVAWKDTKPSHRHGAAMRAMMKHFLADYWLVGREVIGLPVRPLYVEEKLGHTGVVSPRERGWDW